jgi:hypothetical protein
VERWDDMLYTARQRNRQDFGDMALLGEIMSPRHFVTGLVRRLLLQEA